MRAGISPALIAFPQWAVSMGQRGRPRRPGRGFTRTNSRSGSQDWPWTRTPCLALRPTYLKGYVYSVDASSLIKEARRRACLTQAQLAHAAGTSLDVQLRAAPTARGGLLAHLREHATEIRSAARKRRIRSIRVLGSTARGKETPTSDVDLLVEFNAAKHGVLPLAGFAADVRAIIGRDVDVTTASLLRDEVRRSALADAVPL